MSSKTVLCLVLICLALAHGVSLDKSRSAKANKVNRAKENAISKRQAQIKGEVTALEHMLSSAKKALINKESVKLMSNFQNQKEKENDNDIANLNLNNILNMITKPAAVIHHDGDKFETERKRDSLNKQIANARLLSLPLDSLTNDLHKLIQPVSHPKIENDNDNDNDNERLRFVEEQRRHMSKLGVGTGNAPTTPTTPPRTGSTTGAGAGSATGGAGPAGASNNNPTYILPIDPYNYMPFFNTYSNVNPFASFYPTPQSPMANNPNIPWNPQMYSNPNMFGSNPNYPWTASPYPLYVAPGPPGAGQTNPQLLYPFGMSPFPPPPPPTSSSYSWLQIRQSPRAKQERLESLKNHFEIDNDEAHEAHIVTEKRTNSIDQSVVHMLPTQASSHSTCDGCQFQDN